VDITVQVRELAKWDVPHFLGSEWNHIRQKIDAQDDKEAQRLILWWKNALLLEPSQAPTFEPAPSDLRAFTQNQEWRKPHLAVLAEHIRSDNSQLRSRWRWVARAYGHELRQLKAHSENVRELLQLDEPPAGRREIRYLSESLEGTEDFAFLERSTRREIARRQTAVKVLESSPQQSSRPDMDTRKPTPEEKDGVLDSIQRLSADINLATKPYGSFENFIKHWLQIADEQEQEQEQEQEP